MIKFGTDGWRGVIGDDFTFENVRVVSQAIADFLIKGNKKNKRIVMGFDRRFLSDDFARTSACIFAANKIKVVISSRAVPAPVVSFNTLYGNYDLGIMITASHNPPKFNGLKIKTSQGAAANSYLTDRVEEFLYKRSPKTMSFEEATRRSLIKIEELEKSNIKFLKKFIDLNQVRKLKLKVLVDNMYGVGDRFAEKILSPCKLKIDYLHDEFNPSFGGVHPEPIEKNLGELIRKVKREKYDLGIALDGDADRIAVVNKDGNFIDAQVLLPLLAIHMVKNRKEKIGIGKTVVGSNLVDDIALSLGVPCYETPIGFKYISNLFKENLICIGGEEAGGIGFKGYMPERDGTASFLVLLEMMALEEKSFDSLLKGLWKKYGKWFFMRTSFSLKRLKKSLDVLRVPNKLLGKKLQRINRSDGIKLIAKDCWLMFRKSGTEPIVRVYAESKSKDETHSLINLGKELIKSL